MQEHMMYEPSCEGGSAKLKDAVDEFVGYITFDAGLQGGRSATRACVKCGKKGEHAFCL